MEQQELQIGDSMLMVLNCYDGSIYTPETSKGYKSGLPPHFKELAVQTFFNFYIFIWLHQVLVTACGASL